ncbi:MAG: DMT family transporter [Candidatus Limnocylindrus sp.]
MSSQKGKTRMQLIALGFFILAAGVASSVQAVVNAELGRRTDPITAATVSFIGGLAVLLVIGVVSGRMQLAEATQIPPLLLTGGLFGVLIVTGFATVVPILGVTEATLIYILGSLAAALAIDAFGLLGAPQIPVTLARVAGIVLAVVGFLLARR